MKPISISSAAARAAELSGERSGSGVNRGAAGSFLCVLFALLCPVVASGKAVRVDNATGIPVVVALAGVDVGVIQPGATLTAEWDFKEDGIADASSQTVTVSGVDAGGLLATSPSFTLNENERTLVVGVSRAAGVVGVAVSELLARPARTRWGLAVATSGFLSGLIMGAVFMYWRLTYESFQDSL